MTQPTHEQIIDYLNGELPGFEARILRSSNDMMTTFAVRTRLAFGKNLEIDTYALHADPQEAARAVDYLIKETRLDAIAQLGLQKQIDAQIEEKTRQAVAAAKDEWEQKGWQKGYAAATKDLIVDLRDALTAPLREREL